MKKKILAISIIFLLLCTFFVSTSVSDEGLIGVFTPVGSSSLEICCSYPINQSTEVWRPPKNLSIQINNSCNIHFYFQNITPTNNVWEEIKNWSNTNGRVEITKSEMLSYGTGTEFIWGNTTYQWSVNITNDNSTWLNSTFTYTTNQTVSGEDTRYDVNNDNAIDTFDISITWGHRTSVAPFNAYNKIYDTFPDNVVDVFDLSKLWGYRTI